MPICIQTPILKVWSDFTSPRWSTSSIKYLINWDKGVTFWHTVQANQIDIFNISLSVISLIFPFLLYENFDLTFGELIPTLASRVRQLYFQASPDCSRSAREVAVRWPLTFQPHIITRNDEQSFKSSHFFFFRHRVLRHRWSKQSDILARPQTPLRCALFYFSLLKSTYACISVFNHALCAQLILPQARCPSFSLSLCSLHSSTLLSWHTHTYNFMQ